MASPQVLTEYERKRLENIKRNEQMMASLNLQAKVLELKRARVEAKAKSRKPRKKPKPQTPTVIRRSARLEVHDEDDSDVVKHVKTPFQEAYIGDDSEHRVLIDTIMDMSCKSLDYSEKKKGDHDNDDKDRGRFDLDSMVLKPENVARVMPGKITDIKFFPCKERSMIIAGNKFGRLAIWDADCVDEESYGIHLYRPHTNSVSGIAISPFSLSKVFSSGYDGLVHLLDFGKESSDVVYSSGNGIFSLSQRPQDANCLYFSEGHDLLNVWDTRVGLASSWRLQGDGINSIDFSSENTNLMATSSSDGSVSIWDLRRRPKKLKVVNYELAVYSAYFSPSGRCLASSMDSHVEILSGPDYENVSKIPHSNRIGDGRTSSCFRAIWGWDDSYFFIPSLKREVDVIFTVGKVANLQNLEIPSAPRNLATHPYKLGTLSAATSKGTIYLWTENK